MDIEINTLRRGDVYVSTGKNNFYTRTKRCSTLLEHLFEVFRHPLTGYQLFLKEVKINQIADFDQPHIIVFFKFKKPTPQKVSYDKLPPPPSLMPCSGNGALMINFIQYKNQPLVEFFTTKRDGNFLARRIGMQLAEKINMKKWDNTKPEPLYNCVFCGHRKCSGIKKICNPQISIILKIPSYLYSKNMVKSKTNKTCKWHR
jgi:hypothetical protein